MTAVLQRLRTDKDKVTWTCSACTTVNSDHNVNCTVCLSAKPGEKLDLRREQEAVLTKGKVERSLGERVLSLFSRRPLDWRCPVCTNKNGGYYTNCTACGFLKLDEKSKVNETDEDGLFGSITSWFKRKISQEDFSKQGTAKNSQPVLWECQTCTFAENPDSINKCKMCDTKRPQISVDEGLVQPANSSEEDWQSQLEHLDSDSRCPSTRSHISDSGIYSPRTTTPHHTSTSTDYLKEDSWELCDSPSLIPSEDTGSTNSRNYATGHRQKLSPPNGSRSKTTPGNSIQDDTDDISQSDSNSSATVPKCGVHVTPSVDPDPSSAFLGAAGSQEMWRCSVCGAFNRTLRDLPRCYICGIGEAPCSTVHSTTLPPSSGSVDQHQGVCGGEHTAVRHLELTPQPIQVQAYEHERQHQSQSQYSIWNQSQYQYHQDQYHQDQYQGQGQYHQDQYQGQGQYHQDQYQGQGQYHQDQCQGQYHQDQCQGQFHQCQGQFHQYQGQSQYQDQGQYQYHQSQYHQARYQDQGQDHQAQYQDQVQDQRQDHQARYQDQYHQGQYHQSQYHQARYQDQYQDQGQDHQAQYQDQYQDQGQDHQAQYQDQYHQSQHQHQQLANPNIHHNVNTLPPIQENLYPQHQSQQNQQHKQQYKQQQQHKQSQPPQRSSKALESPQYAHRRLLHNSKGTSSMTFEDSMCRSTAKGNCTQLVSVLRHEDEEKAHKMYEEIRKYCRKHREAFIDPDFPPADKSLYINPKTPVTHWKVAQWLRPGYITDEHSCSSVQWAVSRNPGPDDIAQGVLGNCWVLSALTVIAEKGELIENILITKKYCPVEGAYQVRLCKDGRWEVILVDDSFPCFKNKELVFSKAHRKQLWVPLIEKAIAKLYGSYEALNAGRVLSGLSILTGLPCEKIYLKKQSSNDEETDNDLIWAQLLSFRDSGFPMGASCGGHNINEQEYYDVGLEPNHAYSILDVRQINNRERLIRLRNPWGKYSWKGKWSDNDTRWTPQLRDKLQAIGAEEGIFWMDIWDFFNYFCEVDVCKYRPHWYSTRMEGRLLPYAPNQCNLLTFEATMTTEVDISLYQPSLRGGPTSKNLVDLAILVLRYPAADDISTDRKGSIPLPVSCAISSGSHIESIVTCSGLLEAGKYAILPLSFCHWRPPSVKLTSSGSDPKRKRAKTSQGDESIPYTVALFSARELYYENLVLTRPGFLAESLYLLAEKIGTKSRPFPKMLLYEVYLKHACRILVAANHDPHYHFFVTCNGMDSSNIVSTRGELHTEDCIPPMHRQVILVITQLEVTQPYSVSMRIEFNSSRTNAAGEWGATHWPELHQDIMELHSPRLILS